MNVTDTEIEHETRTGTAAMTNTMRRITTSLLNKAQAEHESLQQKLEEGRCKYTDVAYRLVELDRNIAVWTAELA
jgi:hypothetical protein